MYLITMTGDNSMFPETWNATKKSVVPSARKNRSTHFLEYGERGGGWPT
jgi:hypothetical protein